MDVAPRPASGPRIREVGDRLIVAFRPRRSGLVFLSIWLLGWTFFGVEAWGSVAKAGPGQSGFLLFWLCGWFLGECAVICIVAWKVFGHVSLAVTRDELELRQRLGGFSWLRRYDAALVDEIAVGRMPSGEDGRHKDYSLRLSYDGQTVWLGEGMDEREAEHVAAVVLAKIRRTSWWDDGGEPHRQPASDAGDRIQFVAPAHAKAVLIPAMVILALALFTVPIVRRSHHHRSVKPTTRLRSLPARSDFSSAREYAEAVTSWALSPDGSVLVSRPHCGAHPTWTHWSCSATVSSDRATLARGPAMPATPYRCRSVSLGGLTCSLASRLPPINGVP